MTVHRPYAGGREPKAAALWTVPAKSGVRCG